MREFLITITLGIAVTFSVFATAAEAPDSLWYLGSQRRKKHASEGQHDQVPDNRH